MFSHVVEGVAWIRRASGRVKVEKKVRKKTKSGQKTNKKSQKDTKNKEKVTKRYKKGTKSFNTSHNATPKIKFSLQFTQAYRERRPR